MNWKIHQGDCMDVLPTLPAASVHCVVTSPPYFALRSYLPEGHPDKSKEIGSEPTPDLFVATMVAVFREVRRVLRDDGVCWMNLGDSYCSTGGERGYGSSDGQTGRGPGASRMKSMPLKAGDLCMIPHRVAIALQADGWYVRNDVVWSKASPMPESINGTRWERCRVKVAKSVRVGNEKKATSTNGNPHGARAENGKDFDSLAEYELCPGCPKCLPNNGWVLRRGSWRHTRAHEFVFQLVKSPKYFADAQGVAEKSNGAVPGNKDPGKAAKYAGESNSFTRRSEQHGSMVGTDTRNPRSVLTFSNEPSKEQHYAAFPTKLVEPFLRASTSPQGCCPKCGAGIARMIERKRVPTRSGDNSKVHGTKAITHRAHHDPAIVGNRDPERHIQITETLGWRPTCDCEAETPVPMTVLDPFNGTATVGVVCQRLGLDYVGIELNPEYVSISQRRLGGLPLFAKEAS